MQVKRSAAQDLVCRRDSRSQNHNQNSLLVPIPSARLSWAIKSSAVHPHQVPQYLVRALLEVPISKLVENHLSKSHNSFNGFNSLGYQSEFQERP